MALGITIGGALYNNFKLELFIAVTIVLLVNSIVINFFLQDFNINKINKIHKKSGVFLKNTLATYKEVFKDKAYLNLVLGLAFVIMAELSMSSYVVVRLKEGFTSVVLYGFLINDVFNIIGISLSGYLLSLISIKYILLINMLTFLISALCNTFINRVTERELKNFAFTNYYKNFMEGVHFIRKNHDLKLMLVLSTASSASIQFANTMMLPYVKHVLNGSSIVYSILEISFAIGSIVAGLALSLLLKAFRQNLILISLLLMGLVYGLSFFLASDILTPLIFIVIGFSTQVHLILLQTLIQLKAPKHLVGRIVGARSFVLSLAKITVGLGAGFIGELIKPDREFFLFGLFMLSYLILAAPIKKLNIPASYYVKESENKSLAK